MYNYLKNIYGVSDEIINLLKEAEKDTAPYMQRAEEIAQYNTFKVLNSFRKHNISEMHLGTTTGYGYDDVGRDTLDKVYADAFGAEDAIVRHNIVNGTMALASCLYGILRPGDKLLAVTGKPYDTLEEVIGVRGEGNGSLKDFGVDYAEVDLKDGKPDLQAIKNAIDDKVKMVAIQRSRGYAWRDSLSVEEIGEIVKTVKSVREDIVCFVDNCYGEFTDKKEPTEYGVDIMAGSLIKNPGGGLARSGGYVAGKAKYVELVSYRLTCPGIGRECGASLGQNRIMYQGFFMAPHVVCQSIKAGILCSYIFEKMGYEVTPSYKAARNDIITSVMLKSPEKMKAFAKGVQSGSPIDSFVTPEAWAMPGYESDVIMAAGTFVSGASIEVSADGPIREPYTIYYQGGLTYDSTKLPIALAADLVKKAEE